MSEFSEYPPKVDDVDWNQLLDHGLIKAASYIVRKIGSTYEAINGTTGMRLTSGSNPVTVINTALTSAGNVDGTVMVRAATYACSSSDLPIVISGNARLMGEGRGTLFTRSGSDGNPIFRLGADSGTDGTNAVLEKVMIDGQSTAGWGVQFAYGAGGAQSYLHDVNITRCNGGGVILEGWWQQVRNCRIYQNAGEGITVQLRSGSYGYHCAVLDCLLKQNSGHNFHQVRTDGYGATIVQNSLFEFAGGSNYGIYVDRHPIHVINCGCENNGNNENSMYIGANSAGSVNSRILSCHGLGNVYIHYATGTVIENCAFRYWSPEYSQIHVDSQATDTHIRNCHRYTSGHLCDVTDNGTRTRIEGVGKIASGTPSASNWKIGEIVYVTSGDNFYIKGHDGVMHQITMTS